MKRDHTDANGKSLRSYVRWAARAMLALLLMTGGYAAYFWATGNFHVVESGKFYRSGQPTPELLRTWHQRHGITTVINLRGAHPGVDWYDAEEKAVNELGIKLINYPISASRELTETQVVEILAILNSLDGPTLVHCMSGADRSGIVSAFYLADVAKAGEMAAELQLTPIYGHIPLWFLRFYAMDRTFEANEPRFGYYDS